MTGESLWGVFSGYLLGQLLLLPLYLLAAHRRRGRTHPAHLWTLQRALVGLSLAMPWLLLVPLPAVVATPGPAPLVTAVQSIRSVTVEYVATTATNAEPPASIALPSPAPAVRKTQPATRVDLISWAGWILFAATLGGAAWLAAASIGQTAHLRRIARRACRLPAPGSVPVLAWAALPSPLCAGVIRPRIYLPATASEGAFRDTVVAHEMEHIRAGHLLWAALDRVYTSLTWYNPLSVVLARWGYAARELCCDRAVSGRVGIQPYAEAILAAAAVGSRRATHATGWTGAVTVRERILGVQEPPARTQLAARLGALSLIALCVVLAAGVSSCRDGVGRPATDHQGSAGAPAGTPLVLSEESGRRYKEAQTLFTNGDYFGAARAIERLLLDDPDARNYRPLVDLQRRVELEVADLGPWQAVAYPVEGLAVRVRSAGIGSELEVQAAADITHGLQFRARMLRHVYHTWLLQDPAIRGSASLVLRIVGGQVREASAQSRDIRNTAFLQAVEAAAGAWWFGETDAAVEVDLTVPLVFGTVPQALSREHLEYVRTQTGAAAAHLLDSYGVIVEDGVRELPTSGVDLDRLWESLVTTGLESYFTVHIPGLHALGERPPNAFLVASSLAGSAGSPSIKTLHQAAGEPQGSIIYRIVLDAAGEVQSADTVDTDMADSGFAETLRLALLGWRYPPDVATDGDPLTVTVGQGPYFLCYTFRRSLFPAFRAYQIGGDWWGELQAGMGSSLWPQ